MQITFIPYIITNGKGKEAVEFYKNAIGAEVVNFSTFGEGHANSDFPMPEEAKDLVMHAHLKIGTSEFMLSDNFPGQPYHLGNNMSIAIVLDDQEKAKDIFEKLSEGGKVELPMQKTDWSPLYGSLVDKYGMQWQVSVENDD